MNKKTNSANNLRAIRTMLGYSRHQMGLLLNVSKPTIANWETSEPHISTETYNILVQCGINPIFIFSGGRMTKEELSINEIKKRCENKCIKTFLQRSKT